MRFYEIEVDGSMTPVVEIDSSGSKEERIVNYMEDQAKKFAEKEAKALAEFVSISKEGKVKPLSRLKASLLKRKLALKGEG